MQEVLADVLPQVDEHYFLPLYGSFGLPRHASQPENCAAHEPRAKPLPCWSLFTEGHIGADGHLSACCFDHSSRFSMGDLTRMPFLEAWHSPRFQELREYHLQHDVAATVCASCIDYQ